MENKGLLFIPDISGFTRFVNETEIGHSRMIIQELLEGIINANQLGLEISEIEGDAILFYRYGEPPGLDALYRQVESMFCAFHRSLIAYDLRKYCQCKACVAAAGLTLKIITHFGEFTGYRVKQFDKLIGKDVIIVHQLLKNDIANHEYWLVTRSLLGGNRPAGFEDWMEWNAGTRQTESGEVTYHYTPLGSLKKKLNPQQLQPVNLEGMVKRLSFTKDYDTDIITLFHATGDFSNRSRWKEGVSRVEDVNHLLPRVGMRCRCVLDTGKAVTYVSSYYSYQPDKIEFWETEEESNESTHFTLQKLDDNKTRFTIGVHFPKSLAAAFAFMLTRKRKMQNGLERSMQNLAELVKPV